MLVLKKDGYEPMNFSPRVIETKEDSNCIYYHIEADHIVEQIEKYIKELENHKKETNETNS